MDFDFDHRAHLIAPLAELAELGRILQVMLVASTGPELFGLKSLLHLTALKDLSSRLAAPVYKRIQDFQRSEDSRWATLTLNRALLRNLYEPGVGGVDSFNYREKAEAARPETYLWGRGIWIFGRNLAQSFTAHGHCAEASGNTGAPFHQGLPVREVPISATETAWSSVEVAIDEVNANALTRMGMTTMVGRASANFAYFPLLVNMCRKIPGHLSLDGAVAQQLFAGHLSHYTLKLLESAPTEAGDEEVQAHFMEGFTSFLGPIGGEGSVSVDVGEREGNGRTARIQVKPTLEIEEKEIDLTFELPIQS
jgi:predicted component of type VI protein secretion system